MNRLGGKKKEQFPLKNSINGEGSCSLMGVPRNVTPSKIPTKTLAQEQDLAHTGHSVSSSDH